MPIPGPQRAGVPSQHKHPPISVRLPDGDRAWLLACAEREGRSVNSLLAEGVAALRAARERHGTTKKRQDRKKGE